MEPVNTEELLNMLHYCANVLLTAYGKTQSTQFWDAFEKTTEACNSLLGQPLMNNTITYH